ncbi:MAG: SLC13 family permease [Phycisphaerae bacterium]|jgi:Na+/H+ antiporter NhaD/arsenite permease-like protein
MHTTLAVAIFVISYLFIISEKINKTIVAIIGAALMLGCRLITFEQAIEGVDFNVIFLLVGMMTCVFIVSKTGFFEWSAISIAKASKGNPVTILLALIFTTAIFSAFLDNVTTIILLVPVTILITQLLELPVVPFVVLEAIASNIGGTATLIGDPPNIIIGSQGNLSFNDFIVNLAPAIGIILIVFALTVYLIFGKMLKVPQSVRERVTKAEPALAIVDKKRMIRSLSILGLILLCFFLHSMLQVEPGVIALAGSMLMMLVCNVESEEVLMKVEWAVIFFFIGLFMMISGLEHNGVIEWLSVNMLNIAGNNLFVLCMVVLIGSAVLSAVLDNIPFVITMVPLLKLCFPELATQLGITDPALIHQQIAAPLWWSLAMGACLGGNGTLIGASANVVMSQICHRNKIHISFLKFTKYGAGFMLQSVVLSGVYIWLRYFYMTSTGL